MPGLVTPPFRNENFVLMGSNVLPLPLLCGATELSCAPCCHFHKVSSFPGQRMLYARCIIPEVGTSHANSHFTVIFCVV